MRCTGGRSSSRKSSTCSPLPDGSPRVSEERLNRVLDLYRRERWALTEPADTRPPDAVYAAAPVSARILSTGTRLFASAAEDLAASDFGEQRWKVRQTVADFDRLYAADRPPQDVTYRSAAPTIMERYPRIAEHLDRISRFRGRSLRRPADGRRHGGGAPGAVDAPRRGRAPLWASGRLHPCSLKCPPSSGHSRGPSWRRQRSFSRTSRARSFSRTSSRSGRLRWRTPTPWRTADSPAPRTGRTRCARAA